MESSGGDAKSPHPPVEDPVVQGARGSKKPVPPTHIRETQGGSSMRKTSGGRANRF